MISSSNLTTHLTLNVFEEIVPTNQRPVTVFMHMTQSPLIIAPDVAECLILQINVWSGVDYI